MLKILFLCQWDGGVPVFMMTSSNGNIFRVTGPLCGEFTGHRWIPRTKASDAELWCYIWSLNKQLSKQLRGWWFLDVNALIMTSLKSSWPGFRAAAGSAGIGWVCVLPVNPEPYPLSHPPPHSTPHHTTLIPPHPTPTTRWNRQGAHQPHRIYSSICSYDDILLHLYWYLEFILIWLCCISYYVWSETISNPVWIQTTGNVSVILNGIKCK